MDNPFESIMNRLDDLEKKFDQVTSVLESKASPPDQEEPLTVGQAAEFLSMKKNTVYYMTSRDLIPFVKRGKYLYFFKKDLINWLRSSRKPASFEIEHGLLNFPVRKRKALRVHSFQQ